MLKPLAYDLKRISVFFVILSLVFGALIRIFAILNFTEFCGDQIRDAITTMEMWRGNYPTLGPISSWRSAYLPPLYFYFVFPFTALSPDLSTQAIFNGITTFLSIPLLMFTVYQSLEKVQKNKRLFLSTLAGFWYSLLFQNIVMNTGNSLAGNPGSVVFFLLAFILLFTDILESKLPPLKEGLYWLAYGFVFASLINLQFAPLFVMPVIFLISLIFYLYKNRKSSLKIIFPILGILTVIIALTPYWLGEIERNWLNTKEILALVFETSEEKKYSMSLFQRLLAVVKGYFAIGQEGYFIGLSRINRLISLGFMGVILGYGMIKYQGNKTIYYLWLMISLVFLYAYSSVNMENTYNPVFYKLLIYLVPIFLAIWCLAYLDFSNHLQQIIILFLSFCISFCLLINFKFHYNYVTARIGMPRIPNTNDLVQIVKEIPDQATVCDARSYYRNLRIYEYIDRYMTQKNLQFIGQCYPNNYLIYSKYLSNPQTYRLSQTRKIDDLPNFNYSYHLYKETPLFYIYQID